MTEEEWETEKSPGTLLSTIRQLNRRSVVSASRKYRRFAIEAVRPLLADHRNLALTDFLRSFEQFTEQVVTFGVMTQVASDLDHSLIKEGLGWSIKQLGEAMASPDPYSSAYDTARVSSDLHEWRNDWNTVSTSDSYCQNLYEWGEAVPSLRSLIRDIFGNPFRPVAFDHNWRTSDTVAIAQAMYESRDFSPMPILADALQDAGCEHAEILDHCRGAGPHVRGCWVVDLVLGKA